MGIKMLEIECSYCKRKIPSEQYASHVTKHIKGSETLRTGVKAVNIKEKEYYERVKAALENFFKTTFEEVRLEITSDGKFSNELKSKIGQHKDIIFLFLRKGNSPDITGFVSNLKEELKAKYGYGYDGFVTVEFKKDQIKIDDIYQARKYAELFDARYGFLISLQPLPEEIKRLSKAIYSFLSLPAYRTLILIHFDEKTENFTEWFPEKLFVR